MKVEGEPVGKKEGTSRRGGGIQSECFRYTYGNIIMTPIAVYNSHMLVKT